MHHTVLNCQLRICTASDAQISVKWLKLHSFTFGSRETKQTFFIISLTIIQSFNIKKAKRLIMQFAAAHIRRKLVTKRQQSKINNRQSQSLALAGTHKITLNAQCGGFLLIIIIVVVIVIITITIINKNIIRQQV
jgi:hypothetical protein